MTKLLFLDDSYLKDASARVTEITEDGVVLDRTIFYPLGGGQSNDTGIIEGGDTAYEVKNVKKVSGKIVHFIDMCHGDIKKGDNVKISIDWDKRYTMMKYHTALHLISNIAFKHYGAAITGNNISCEKARIDLDLEGLSEDVVKSIEDKVNGIIAQGLEVAIKEFPRDEAEKMVDPAKTRLDLIPSFIKNIRLVIINGFDVDACGGTHVRNTKEIGKIEIFNTINKGKNRKRLELRLV